MEGESQNVTVTLLDGILDRDVVLTVTSSDGTAKGKDGMRYM